MITRILTAVERKQQTWLTVAVGALLATVFILFLTGVQFATPALPGTDGYYHIRLAEVMGREGLRPDFPWLPLSILNAEEYSDHHFLFHVALIPFTWGDIRSGAKWSAIILPMLAFLSIWWLLDRQRIPLSALWALGLMAISEAFIYRMSLVRAQSLSLAFLVLGLYWMQTGKYRLLIPLGFFYVWLYDAFPLLGILAGVYTLAVLLTERRLELRPLIFTGVGIAAGLLINPYFPDNVIFFYKHLLPKVTEVTAVSVGSEWYPYKTTQLLENSALALVAFFSGTVALGFQEKRMDARTAASFITALLFGAMLFQSRRWVEYFPPFALIFAAFAWAPLIAGAGKQGGWRKTVAAVVLIAALIPGVWITFQKSQDSVRDSKPYAQYAEASQWLAENTPEGAMIFQTDWDDFTRLFYWNTRNTYMIGLDPTYMQLYDGELYALWVDITHGDVELPSQQIVERFGARYIFSDLNHSRFIRQAEKDPGMEEAYRDEYAVIYRIVE
ncbi:MAG: hypothetical protein L0Z70_16265 [Chloroflexi bacterium]|nr:hypothetical protein [Chloroflexota bacterium]